jgi:hypothetical protein
MYSKGKVVRNPDRKGIVRKLAVGWSTKFKFYVKESVGLNWLWINSVCMVLCAVNVLSGPQMGEEYFAQPKKN